MAHISDQHNMARGTTDQVQKRDSVPTNVVAAASSVACVAGLGQSRAFTFNATGLANYQNGALIASNATFNGTWESVFGVITVGNRGSLDRALNGLVTPPLIFSRALSARELQALHLAYSAAGDFRGAVA